MKVSRTYCPSFRVESFTGRHNVEDLSSPQIEFVCVVLSRRSGCSIILRRVLVDLGIAGSPYLALINFSDLASENRKWLGYVTVDGFDYACIRQSLAASASLLNASQSRLAFFRSGIVDFQLDASLKALTV